MKQPPRPQTYTQVDAEKIGYQSITTPYLKGSKREMEQLERVLQDMVGLEHCIIESAYGLEVGRLKIELL
jgi:hypothetical protein